MMVKKISAIGIKFTGRCIDICIFLAPTGALGEAMLSVRAFFPQIMSSSSILKSKKAGKQAGKQASKQAGTQASKQAVRQGSKQAVRQESKQTGKEAGKHATMQATRH